MTIKDPVPRLKRATPQWLAKNIQQGHGPLGVVYPDTVYGNEGDTETFLGLIPNGLNDPSHPDYGGWGGRFMLAQPAILQTFPSSQNLVRAVPETRPLWVSATDQYPGPMEGPNFFANLFSSNKPQESVDRPRDTLVPAWRWHADAQNDFAARMTWTTKGYGEANHPPTVVLGKNTPAKMRVKSGQEFHLDASGSYDKDGDSLSYSWLQYAEAGNFPTSVSFLPFSPSLADLPVVAPKVDSDKTLHFIVRVTDKGTPPLSRYRRIIVHVHP